ncbi:MAG: hypothetical protein GYA42_05065 [Syntrophomonadaceae bacterium]|nr:hypothetical protein [Syntrophomonadaceae bacterium]
MTDMQESGKNSFDLIGESLNRMWLLWQSNLSTLYNLQAQMEKMTRTQLDQNRAGREEWARMVSELGRQTQQNQEQFQKMLQGAVESSYRYFNLSS